MYRVEVNVPPFHLSSITSLLRPRDSGLEFEIGFSDSWKFLCLMTMLSCWQGHLEGEWKERVQNLMRSWVCPELRVRWLSAGRFSLEGCPLVKCTCVCWVPELSLGHLRCRLVQLHLTKKMSKIASKKIFPSNLGFKFFPPHCCQDPSHLILMGVIFLRGYWWEEGECVKK